jgi:hypothetical protein
MPNNWHGQPAYLPPGDPEQMSEASLHAPGQLGMRFTIKQPAGSGTPGLEEFRFKTYQIVKTDSSMTVSPFKGAVAWWSDKTGYVVTTSPTALGRGRVAGVFQNLAAYPITKGHYWVPASRSSSMRRPRHRPQRASSSFRLPQPARRTVWRRARRRPIRHSASRRVSTMRPTPKASSTSMCRTRSKGGMNADSSRNHP